MWGEHRAAGVLRCNCPVALLLLGRLTARQVGVKCFSPPHVIPVPHLGSVEGRQSRCAATQACARVASPPTRQRRLVPGGQAVAVAVRSSRVRTALFPPVDAPSTLRRSRAPGRSQSQFPSSPTLPSAARPRAPWLAPRRRLTRGPGEAFCDFGEFLCDDTKAFFESKLTAGLCRTHRALRMAQHTSGYARHSTLSSADLLYHPDPPPPPKRRRWLSQAWWTRAKLSVLLARPGLWLQVALCPGGAQRRPLSPCTGQLAPAGQAG